MEMTKHASIRQQQRSISPMIIEFLINYGVCEKAVHSIISDTLSYRLLCGLQHTYFNVQAGCSGHIY